jgi:tripartite-type tricarboxylate transporter receptor subunit TctC
VPYRGSAAALTDLVGGQIAMVFTTTADLAQMHKGGRIRMLATSDRARSPFVPEVPTFREAGYDLAATGWYGIFAPAKTPPETIERLNKAIVAAVQLPDTKERMLALGLQPTGTSAKGFAEIQKQDSARWAPHVKASGFKPEQ